MGLKERVLSFINENHIKNKGQRGLAFYEITNALNVEFLELKPVLNALYKNGDIIFRPGINHKLFYKNDTQPNQTD